MGKVVYILAFLIAFAVTTGAIYFFNQKYENIFKFNFSPVKEQAAQNPVTGKPAAENKTPAAPVEVAQANQSPVKSDTASIARTGKNTKEDSLRTMLNEINNLKSENTKLKKTETALVEKESELQKVKATVKSQQDSAYVKWKKEMVKIYEAMDSRVAAKIIPKLADNLARDILFSMKKKKAAQIISELNPETATRLTKVQ